jgi:hypothetical protein
MRTPTILAHETSVASAIAIVDSGLISGAPWSGNSHEAYPHFYLNDQPRHRNHLGSGALEITLFFRSDLPILSASSRVPDGGCPRNQIITMNGVDGQLWQAVVSPGSVALQLTRFELEPGSSLTDNQRRKLNQACLSGKAIEACFF